MAEEEILLVLTFFQRLVYFTYIEITLFVSGFQIGFKKIRVLNYRNISDNLCHPVTKLESPEYPAL
jgi:hypothetical protein